jgi:hypothetical protein
MTGGITYQRRTHHNIHVWAHRQGYTQIELADEVQQLQ